MELDFRCPKCQTATPVPLQESIPSVTVTCPRCKSRFEVALSWSSASSGIPEHGESYYPVVYPRPEITAASKIKGASVGKGAGSKIGMGRGRGGGGLGGLG
jgi:hypothetical protein